jgi:hypothetical protein|eukprot:COSAG01_NODE_2352_length_7850_cov_62.040898_2_plen_118_part_00
MAPAPVTGGADCSAFSPGSGVRLGPTEPSANAGMPASPLCRSSAEEPLGADHRAAGGLHLTDSVMKPPVGDVKHDRECTAVDLAPVRLPPIITVPHGATSTSSAASRCCHGRWGFNN